MFFWTLTTGARCISSVHFGRSNAYYSDGLHTATQVYTLAPDATANLTKTAIPAARVPSARTPPGVNLALHQYATQSSVHLTNVASNAVVRSMPLRQRESGRQLQQRLAGPYQQPVPGLVAGGPGAGVQPDDSRNLEPSKNEGQVARTAAPTA